MKSEKSFEERGAKILRYLHQDLRHNLEKIPPPMIIEITGTPDAGKTTIIEQLDNDFRKIDFTVKCPLEGAREIRHINRKTPLYNLRTGLYSLDMLIDFTSGHMYDLVIFDRAVFDAYTWMMYWQDKNRLTEEEKCLYQQFFMSKFWVNKVDVVWFITCEPEEAMRRYQRNSQIRRVGESTNPETIQTRINQYREAYEKLKPQFAQLNFLDTTHLDEKTMVETVTNRTLELLEQKINQKTAR